MEEGGPPAPPSSMGAGLRAPRASFYFFVTFQNTGAGAISFQIGANVVAACFIIDLPDLGGAAKLRAMDVPVRTLMTFEGH